MLNIEGGNTNILINMFFYIDFSWMGAQNNLLQYKK